MESDSRGAIQSIMDKIQVSKQIFILIEDINYLAGNSKNIRFWYCNGTGNTLTDKIARKTYNVSYEEM